MALTDAGHISEFITDSTGKFWNGTCGECALEVAKAAIQGHLATQLDMLALTHDMMNHNESGVTGASTVAGLADEATRQGFTILHQTNYVEPLTEDWHSEVLAHGGIDPIILEFAQAHNLKDVETGSADEAGVQYHYIVILGKQADGYVANDGDNPQVTSHFQVYTYADLASAVLILAGPTAAAPTPPSAPKGTPVSVVTTGLGTGMAAYAVALGNAGNSVAVLLPETYSADSTWSFAALTVTAADKSVRQVVLFYAASLGVRDDMAGEVARRLQAEWVALNTTNQALNTQVTDLKAQLAKAQPVNLSAVKNALSGVVNALAPVVSASGAAQSALASLNSSGS